MIKMKLKKELNALDVFSIVAGAMISSGIFILPGLAYAKTGPSLFLSYFLSGLINITVLLAAVELVTAMPKAGADYFFIMRGLGPAIGTIMGFLSWLSIALKSSFALIGIAEFGNVYLNLNFHIVGLIFATIFTILNIIGIKEAGRTQVFLTLTLLFIMFFYILTGISKININYFHNFAPRGIIPIFTTAGFVFVSYGGLIKSLSIAEEVKDPKKNIPLGILGAFFVVVTVYVLTSFVVVGTLDGPKLKNSLTPLSDSAFQFLGKKGIVIISIGAFLAFVTTANAGIMASARALYALSKDKLIPKTFEKIHPKFGTPYVTIIITYIFIVITLFIRLESIVKVASTFTILNYIFINLAFIVIKESKLINYKPTFKAPLYPFLPIIGIIGLIFILAEMGNETLIASLGIISISILIYLFFGRLNVNRESALILLVSKITSKELKHRFLEEELKEIIRESENIKEDEVDRVFKNSIIFDLKQKINYRSLFKIISEEISKRLKIPSKEIYNLFLKRERENSTVISSKIAIPHIVIRGKNKFILIITRALKGVYFSKKYPSVNAIFFIVGSKDKRNLHLKTIAAIAQIWQYSDFEKKWSLAKNNEDIKDLLLLSERKREL
jgi:amino acid transporter/mannitol/fructose-specific phosphotransferase system IIA component (Ntr-type)